MLLKEGASGHLWLWWNDIVVLTECMVPITGSDVSEAMEKLEARLQTFGIDEIQGIRMYGLDTLSDEERNDMEEIISMYGENEYIPLLFLGRSRNRCKKGPIRLGYGNWYGRKGA